MLQNSTWSFDDRYLPGFIIYISISFDVTVTNDCSNLNEYIDKKGTITKDHVNTGFFSWNWQILNSNSRLFEHIFTQNFWNFDKSTIHNFIWNFRQKWRKHKKSYKKKCHCWFIYLQSFCLYFIKKTESLSQQQQKNCFFSTCVLLTYQFNSNSSILWALHDWLWAINDFANFTLYQQLF